MLRAALRGVPLVPLVLPVLSVRRGAAGVCRFRLRLCRVGPCPGLCLEGPCPERLCRAASFPEGLCRVASFPEGLRLEELCLEGPCPGTAGVGACPDRERPWEECDECAASALRARE